MTGGLAELQIPDEHTYWRQDAQDKLLGMLEAGATQRWKPFYCPNHGCNGQPHAMPIDVRDCPYPYGHEWEREKFESEELILHNGAARCYHCGVLGHPVDEWTFTHARADQRPPRWSAKWLTLFQRSGRGTGKTRMGAEITNAVAKAANIPELTLIAPTGPDIRNTLVEGRSGILATSPPDFRPVWEPSKKQLTWPNGVKALGYSAEEPDRLRGQNSGFVWGDEPAHWALVEECWENMLYGLRAGKHPKIVATSTPKATKWVKKQVVDPLTIDRRVSSWANLTNLSEMYRHSVLDPKKGTRLGQQELEGEILDDVEGALWQWEWINHVDPETLPDLTRLVVSIDPAGTANKRSDETGIVAVALGRDRHIYVIADWSGRFSPETWARRAFNLADRLSADAIVFEKNYGGDMVRRVLTAEEEARGDMYLSPRFQEVTSRRGKDIRAEPVAQLYEKRRVHHVGDRDLFAKLEEEQTTWVPGSGMPSPNRLDALVHGVTHLFRGGGNYAIASPLELD